MKRVCEYLISFRCLRITLLPPVLMHAMYFNTLVVAFRLKAIEWGFYGFYDQRILLSDSLSMIRRGLFDSFDPRLVFLNTARFSF